MCFFCCTFRDFIRWCKRRVLNCWLGCLLPDCLWWGFCRCPHGPCYTTIGVLIAFGACWMNMYVIVSCKFAQITERNPVTGELIEATKLGYGLLAREIGYGDEKSYRGCIMYPDDEAEIMYDFWLETARNLAFVGGILGLITLTCMVGSCCFLCEPWNFERWLLWCCIWASICMAFTNLVFANWFCKENTCKVSYGTGYAVSAFMTYLMAANQIKSMGQPPPKKDMPEPGGREDDLWYDNEEDRFLEDDDSEYEDSDEDMDNFEDENNDDKRKKRSTKQPRRRRRRNKPEEGVATEEGSFVNNHDNYDEMQPYMGPEDEYAPPQDADFLQRDKEHQDRLYQEKTAGQQPGGQQPYGHTPQPMPRQYGGGSDPHYPSGGGVNGLADIPIQEVDEEEEDDSRNGDDSTKGQFA